MGSVHLPLIPTQYPDTHLLESSKACLRGPQLHKDDVPFSPNAIAWDEPFDETPMHTSTSSSPMDLWSIFVNQDMMGPPSHIQPLQPRVQASAFRLQDSSHYAFVPTFPQPDNIPVDFVTMQDQSDVDALFLPISQHTTRSCVEAKDDMQSISQESLSSSLHFLHRLEAPSALMKDADGIPTTYLNKASNYTIVVRDSSSSPPNDGLMMYRTTLRIEFDAEYQRQDPAAFWILRDRNKQLTTDEAHPNGETPSVPFIQCMEYRTTDHPEAMTNVRAAHQSGFSILWSANPFGSKQCTVVIRMNFLSTDFTHVQGVKGDALRLCIKTEAISAASEMSEQLPSLDHIAGYCRIKLFRSHGAERKMSNDMINAKKRIKGFEKQLSGSKINRALVEQDSAEPSNKRAEKGSAKRTRARLEDELTTKIMKWKSLCGSAQECTYFRPYDRHSPMEDQRAANWDVVASMPEEEAEYKPTSNLNSPTCPPSAMDVLSPESNPFHTSVSNDSGQGVADATSPQQGKRRTPMPRRSRRASVKLTRQVDHDQKATQSIPPLERSNSSVHGRKRCEIEAADLAGFPINISKFRQPGTENMKPTTIAERDTNTLPIIPTSHPDKCLSGHRGKTVCFYVQTVESASKSMISNLKSPHSRSTQDPFTAIYLASRTAKEFVAVLAKWRGLDPGLVGKCTWRTANGVDVFVDDDVVAYLEEGTEMGVQVVNGGREVGVKEEMGDGEGGSGCRSRGMVEIRIFF